MFITILIFIIILGLLVFIHELGHFLVAKKSGMQVHEFGFGFPPRVFGVQKKDGKLVLNFGKGKNFDQTRTIYSINLIPLGGFVKILGENNEGHEDPSSFVNKPFFARFLVLSAGVFMNVILAWVLFSSGFMTGLPQALENVKDVPPGATIHDPHLAVLDVEPNSPAARAGLKPNDFILSVDAMSFADSDKIRNYIRSNSGKKFIFEIKRAGNNTQIQVQSRADFSEESGPTGIALAVVGKVRYVWYRALYEGARATIGSLSQIGRGLYDLFTSGKGLGVTFNSLGGPVKIASLTGEVAKMGFVYLLQFTAFLSLNLAILNALPIPALDGGRILFLLIEKIRGKANNPSVEQWANTLGFLTLLLLMLAVTVKDVLGVIR